MKKFAAYVFAFCTFWGILIHNNVAEGNAPKLGENFTHYNKSQVQWGAMTLPLSAQLHYEAATRQIKGGDLEKAAWHLEEALRLNPQFPDAYLTLSKIKFRQFDPDALYYLVLGFRSVTGNFKNQSLLAVNAALFVVLMLVMLTTIACLSFAIRYLPFVAHKIGELLKTRFHAALPRLTAYLIILIPFAIFPGFIYGVCLLVLMTWYFMHRRERLAVIALLTPFILLGIFEPKTKQLNPLADPMSFTHLAAKATSSAGDSDLIKSIGQISSPSLEVEKHNTLGVLYLRQENYEASASHLLRAIELRPANTMGYVNLGNVYYLQEQYQKALEGYRKAAQIDDTDAVGQYNLAQAYIKTLLMAESSTALKKAAAGGIDDVKQSYAEMVRPLVQVYHKTFSPAELWQIARIEGQNHSGNFLSDVLRPITRTPVRVSAWMLLGTLLIAMLLSRVFKQRYLSFQCSNCGQLTCDNCCNNSGGMYLCGKCAEVINGVSSDKVVEALLRQRRHSVIVKRRRTVRVVTTWIPGVRDIFYGRLTRGLALAAVFSSSLILLWTKGFVIKDWNSLVTTVPLWKWALPIAGITITYASSWFSKQYYELRNHRTPTMRQRRKDSAKEDERSVNRASA